jgi:hypothetical protein
VNLGVYQVGGDVDGLLSIDEDILVIFGVVCWASGDLEHILLVVSDFRHLVDVSANDCAL